MCYNTRGSYSCECKPEWTGPNCAEDVNECLSNPCAINSLCVNNVGGYQCECNRGWNGPNCTEDINECLSNPCVNNGKCISLNGTYECLCYDVCTGSSCSNCLRFTCINNSTFMMNNRTQVSASVNKSICLYCENVTNECVFIPCEETEICINISGSNWCDNIPTRSPPLNQKGSLQQDLSLLLLLHRSVIVGCRVYLQI